MPHLRLAVLAFSLFATAAFAQPHDIVVYPPGPMNETPITLGVISSCARGDDGHGPPAPHGDLPHRRDRHHRRQARCVRIPHPEIANKGRLRLSISPWRPDAGARFWAFVSVTNNETRHVTVISTNP